MAARYGVGLDGCRPRAAISNLPDKDPDDGTTIRRAAYRGGRGGTGVVLYTVEGGGYTWPSGAQYAPVGLVGRTNRNMDASDVIWEFFKGTKRR